MRPPIPLESGVCFGRPHDARMAYLKVFSGLGCPELQLSEVLALARKHEIDGVELRAAAATMQ